MPYNSNDYIVFYSVAGVSILASCYVPATIIRYFYHQTYWSLISKLLLSLHITLLIQDISSLPYAYVGNYTLCAIAGFFHIYGGLANILTVFQLTVYYRSLFFDDCARLVRYIERWTSSITYGIPLFTLLGFVSNSYHAYLDAWCTLVNYVESMMMLYVWLWLMLIVSTTITAITILQISRLDLQQSQRVAQTLGLYVIASVLFWFPRTLSFVSKNAFERGYVYTHMIVYLTGIAYLCIFLTEKRYMKEFARDESCEGGKSAEMAGEISEDIDLRFSISESESTMHENSPNVVTIAVPSSRRDDTLNAIHGQSSL
mmetsp:Transcript_6981/g.11651  ORF Transcript_6981/g.11651 Transcript_6981/m.11651 type:complete len:315 (-) Transcript_6981:190-1134(-)